MPIFSITRRDFRLAVEVKATISSRPSEPKPWAMAARAASGRSRGPSARRVDASRSRPRVPERLQRPVEADEADEVGDAGDLDRPQAPAALLLHAPLDHVGQSVGLGPAQPRGNHSITRGSALSAANGARSLARHGRSSSLSVAIEVGKPAILPRAALRR